MKLIQIFLFLFLGITLNAQLNYEVGTEWFYSTRFFSGGGPSDMVINRHYIDGEATILERPVKVLRRTRQTCDYRPYTDYIFQENDSLYFFNETKNNFQLLYDFSAQVGDTITIPYWEGFSNAGSQFYYRVDSVDTFTLGDQELKRLHVVYDRWDDEIIDFESQNAISDIIIQSIGNMTNFFHFQENGFCDDSYNVELRCFSHPTIGESNFIDAPCNTIISSSKNKNISKGFDFVLYPSPAESNLSFDLVQETSMVYQIIILDVFGRDILQIKNAANTEAIDVSELPAGTYICQVITKDKKYRSSKPFQKL